MNAIYQVLSNLNHNGQAYTVGSFFEAEKAMFEHLVADGVLRLVEGAKDLAHAGEIVAAELMQTEVALEKQLEVEPENTWGAKKDEVVAPKGASDVIPDAGDAEVKKDEVAPGQVGAGDLPPDATAGDNL